MLGLKFHLENKDGTDIDDAEQTYGLINDFPVMAWSYITVYFGSTIIQGDSKSDAYKPFLKQLLQGSTLAKDFWMKQVDLKKNCFFFNKRKKRVTVFFSRCICGSKTTPASTIV
jgi:hypothetical protein